MHMQAPITEGKPPKAAKKPVKSRSVSSVKAPSTPDREVS